MSETQLHIDFDLPLYVIDHFYITGAIGFILNVIVIYLILYHSGKLDSYRYYLLAFQISCMVSDLNISFFGQPIALVPIPAGYPNGIGYRWFSLSSHTLFTLLTMLLSGQIEVLTICFFRKHKAITNLKPNSNPSELTYLGIYVMLIAYTCLMTALMYLSSETREEQIRLLHQHYPSVASKFEALEEFQYFVTNKFMVTFYGLVFAGTLKTGVFVSILVLRMYKSLREVQSQLSSRTLSKHRNALHCLILQFLTTPIGFFPACLLPIAINWPTQYSQELAWFAFMCMPSHSIFNSIVVGLTYPDFRKALQFWRKRPVKIISVNGSQNMLVR